MPACVCLQFETPPPIFDGAVLADLASHYVNRANNHRADAAHFGISEPYLRYKIWSLHSNVFETFCAQKGITYVKNPPEALDEKGFLRGDYWNDFVHGNTAYGALVLRNLGSM